MCWGNNVNREQCYWLTEGGFCDFLLASCRGELAHDFYGEFTGPLTKIEFVR